MKPGEKIEMGKGAVITCLRRADAGGEFEFEIELAPGVDGPPTHHHPEPEYIEVLEGEVVFIVDGAKHQLGPGDVLDIPPGVAHTFHVPKGGGVLRARGRHGGRFERVVDQHAGDGARFTRMAIYLTRVDREASYMVNPMVRGLLAVIAAVGRLRGVRLHGDHARR